MSEFFETIQSPALRVDSEAGVIRDVKIIGRVSKNGGREYSQAVLSQAKEMYEGIVVNCDHPDRRDSGADRKISDRFGWLENVRETDDGLVGDLHILQSHSMSAAVFEAAEKRPQLFGLSHNIQAETTRQSDGKMLIEKITAVYSVDLVSNPATTKSLFEAERVVMKSTVKKIFESIFGTRALREEELPAEMTSDAPVEVPAEAGEDDLVKTAFRAAVIAAFDDSSLDVKATLVRMKEILNAQEKLIGIVAPAAATSVAEAGHDLPGEEDKPPTVESVRFQKMEAKQTALLERVDSLQKKLTHSNDKPRSGRKHLLTEGEESKPMTPEEFARSLR